MWSIIMMHPWNLDLAFSKFKNHRNYVSACQLVSTVVYNGFTERGGIGIVLVSVQYLTGQ